MYRTVLLIFLIMFSADSYSFDLFDKDRGKPPAPPPKPEPSKPVNPFFNQPKPPPPKPKPPPMQPQQDFSLKGIMRIGNKDIVVLEAPNGDVLRQEVGDKRIQLEGYVDYYLMPLKNEREVVLKYPNNAPCRNNNQAKSVRCMEGGEKAELGFKFGNPIKRPPPQQAQANDNKPTNPFLFAAKKHQELSEEEKKRREEALKRRQELYKNFKRQVIKEEDVPPGMRVVRTPFGDRLVPDNR